jgi:hypothetical protein|tara:strand:+ start:1305 stop:1757 length:453 start_codon:yes stop_codon:yes gene_type:complete
MNIEIQPFVGFGQIQFGQTIEQVKSLLGEPTNSTKEKHEDGTDDISLLYGEQGVELSFMSEDDFRLGLITCYAPTYTVEGTSYTGLSEEDFKKTATFDDLKQDDEFAEPNTKDYTVESKGLSFWIQDGFVESITLFPEYTEDGEEIIWPS